MKSFTSLKTLKEAIKVYLEGGEKKEAVIKDYGPIGEWNVSKIRSMKDLFKEARNFNEDISNWDTSKVKNMSGMFYKSSEFNQPIGNWNTSNVTDMSNMFYGAIEFNQSIGNWDTFKVNNMNYMFAFTKKFNQSIRDWTFNPNNFLCCMFHEAEMFNISDNLLEKIDKNMIKQEIVSNEFLLNDRKMVLNLLINKINHSNHEKKKDIENYLNLFINNVLKFIPNKFDIPDEKNKVLTEDIVADTVVSVTDSMADTDSVSDTESVLTNTYSVLNDTDLFTNLINNEFSNQNKSDYSWSNSVFEKINFLKPNNVGRVGENILMSTCLRSNIKCCIDGGKTKESGGGFGDGFIYDKTVEVKTARLGTLGTFQHELGETPWKAEYMAFIDVLPNELYLTIFKNFTEEHYKIQQRTAEPYFKKKITQRKESDVINKGSYKITLNVNDLKESRNTICLQNKNHITSPNDVKDFIISLM